MKFWRRSSGSLETSPKFDIVFSKLMCQLYSPRAIVDCSERKLFFSYTYKCRCGRPGVRLWPWTKFCICQKGFACDCSTQQTGSMGHVRNRIQYLLWMTTWAIVTYEASITTVPCYIFEPSVLLSFWLIAVLNNDSRPPLLNEFKPSFERWCVLQER
jgi:hypothetical protein